MLNRSNCINIYSGFCNNDGQTEFICNKDYTEMLSRIKDTFHPRHKKCLQRENKQHGSFSKIINIETKTA